MKKTFYTFFILIAILVFGTAGIKSVENSGTPPTNNTGATGNYCNSCHSGTNNFNTAGGGVTATGLPSGYSFGTSYSFSITINHASADRRRWGFAIKAVNASGAAIGTFTTTNPNASVGSGELRHSSAPLLTTGVSTYTYNNLKWTAPATNTLANKAVRFFIVAVAADGINGNGGDFVYSKLITAPLATSIKSFTPTQCSSGASVTIKGTSFTGATDVSFGGITAQSFVVNNDSIITAVVGAGASGSVSVTSPAGIASLAGFTYCAVTTTNTNINLFGCNSLVYNGTTYSNSAIVKDTIKAVGGCDSIYRTANITIKKITPATQNSNQNACDKFIYKNVTYNSSTVIKDTLRTQEGCDSIFLTINATVNPSVTGRVYHPTKGLINGVKIVQTGTATNTLVANGNYNAACLAANSNVTFKPSKNNDITKANGVTSVDALLIQRHILNTTKINNAYKLIAADVDGNKAINSVDVLRVKRLILGTDTTFTSTTKGSRLWEFVDSAYVFPDTTNPFPFKDSISFNAISTTKNNQSFVGVKLGDVNYDWISTVARQMPVNSLQLIADRKEQASTLRYTLSTINFKDLATMQYTLHFDNTKYEFVGIENNKLDIDFNSTQANKTGNIAMLWTDKNAQAKTLEDGSELFTLVLRSIVNNRLLTDEGLTLTNDIAEIEAWDNDYRKHNIVLTRKLINNKPQTINEILIYPNPTNGIVNIESINAKQIAIIDALGSTIKQFNNVKKLLTFNCKLLTKGIYIIQATMQDGTVKSEKLVVE